MAHRHTRPIRGIAPLARRNLPLQPSCLLGHEDQLALVRSLLTADDVRLLTRTDPA